MIIFVQGAKINVLFKALALGMLDMIEKIPTED